MVEHLELTVDELLLDEDNPRLGAVSSQSEALEKLVHLNQNHFRNLMISIRENGLDPGDSLYVIEAEDEGDFIVLEGNRRLSAIMVLINPDILDGTDISTSTKKSLARAATGFNRDNVEPIRCVLFADRSDASFLPIEKTRTTGFIDATQVVRRVRGASLGEEQRYRDLPVIVRS